MIEANQIELDVKVAWQTGPAGNQMWKGSFSSSSGFSQFFELPTLSTECCRSLPGAL